MPKVTPVYNVIRYTVLCSRCTEIRVYATKVYSPSSRSHRTPYGSANDSNAVSDPGVLPPASAVIRNLRRRRATLAQGALTMLVSTAPICCTEVHANCGVAIMHRHFNIKAVAMPTNFPLTPCINRIKRVIGLVALEVWPFPFRE